jgi:hypothetical protein
LNLPEPHAPDSFNDLARDLSLIGEIRPFRWADISLHDFPLVKRDTYHVTLGYSENILSLLKKKQRIRIIGILLQSREFSSFSPKHEAPSHSNNEKGP